MANIGLVDVDGHRFPNLALMKIAAWHKKQGDSVTFALPLLPYDRIYMAKVFTLLKEYRKAWKTAKHPPTVYVLTNFNSMLEEDLYRIYTLKDMGYKPYVMIYDKLNAPRQLIKMQRWVNNPIIWYKCPTFEEYKE